MRTMLIAGAALVIATAAMAQAEKEFDLKLTGSEVNMVGEALGELPYKKVVPLMNKLQGQLNAQSQPPKPAVVPEEKKEDKKAE